MIRQMYNIKRNILLTGGTGFLGMHILFEILNTTNAIVYVIGRYESSILLENRIGLLWRYFFKTELSIDFRNRIFCCVGDISKTNLGMDETVYFDLCSKIDCIINSAANVKHYDFRERFYSVNVTGVKNLILFAKTDKEKEIHHISTVYISSNQAGNVFNETDIVENPEYESVYLQTKVEAENILLKERNHIKRVSIYRLGNLQCNSETGMFQPNFQDNSFFMMISAFTSLKTYPFIDFDIEFTQVNSAAKACCALILTQENDNSIFHIYNPNMTSFFDIMKNLEEHVDGMHGVKPHEFFQVLVKNQNEKRVEIYRLMIYFGIQNVTELMNGTQGGSIEELLRNHYYIDCSKTLNALEQAGFRWEDVNKIILDKFSKAILSIKSEAI